MCSTRGATRPAHWRSPVASSAGGDGANSGAGTLAATVPSSGIGASTLGASGSPNLQMRAGAPGPKVSGMLGPRSAEATRAVPSPVHAAVLGKREESALRRNHESAPRRRRWRKAGIFCRLWSSHAHMTRVRVLARLRPPSSLCMPVSDSGIDATENYRPPFPSPITIGCLIAWIIVSWPLFHGVHDRLDNGETRTGADQPGAPVTG